MLQSFVICILESIAIAAQIIVAMAIDPRSIMSFAYIEHRAL